MRFTHLRTACRLSRLRPLICFLVALLGFASGCASSGSDRDQVGQRVDPELARALQNALNVERAAASLPGVAAAVVIPGQGLWSGGSGVANRATKEPVTGRTPFPIASI